MAKIERKNMKLTDSQGRVLRAPKDNASESINFRWWLLPEKDMAPAIAATILFIERHQASRLSLLTEFTRLYGSTSLYNNIGSAFSRARSVQPISTHRMSYNLIESVVDTLQSKLAKNKVIPTYITNGGIWKQQKKAKQLTKFAQGVFYEYNVHNLMMSAWKDAAVWGDGFLYIYSDDQDKLCIDRAFPHEIFVDVVEALNGDPKQLHRVKIVDRDIARELFPELIENIDTVSPASYQDIGGQGTAVDMIKVVESWHLKSGEDAKDGVHVISIGDGALSYEWDKDYFPFAHFRYADRQLGWYGQGACERLQNIQKEINRSMVVKQRSLWMQASFKVLLENGSKIVKQHLDNEIGSIITYSNTPPQYIAPPATNPELQQWIDSLINWGYQQEGVSRMSSQGEIPKGVESGRAMRTFNQISDDRYLYMQQCVEDFALEIARQCVNVIRDVYAKTNTYEVVFPERNFFKAIDWKDIDLEEDSYVLKAYPTSSLSEDITGRLSEIQELAQAGMISPRTARRLMDMPDVEMNDNLSNAAEDLLHKILEEILDDGVYRAPEPFFDLQLAKQLVLEYYNFADFMDAPNDRLALLERFNSQINDLMGIMQPPVMGGMPPGGPQASVPPGGPQAVPLPPPQSNLLPNIPGAA